MAYEYDNLPGLDRKFREDEEPLLVNEQTTEQTEEETDPLARLDLLGGFMQDDYLQGLQTQASEAKQRQTQSMKTMQGIMDEVTADLERRRQEMKPRFTQQELDDRRAKSTAVTMLTSALANIANGIAVGKGGLNATVPDGYTAAYEHWNDVQKRHSARQAEYDKLTDAIWSNRLNKVKLEYGEASAEYQQAQAAYQKAMAQRETQAYGIQKEAIRQMGLNQRQASQQAFTAGQKELDRKNATKNAYIRRSGSGGSSGKSQQPTTEYSYVSDDGTINVTFPQGMDESTAYERMAMAALKQVQNDIADLDNQIKEAEKIAKTSEKEAKLKELKEQRAQKIRLQKSIQTNSSNRNSKTGRTALGKNIAASGVSQEDLEEALNQTQSSNGGTDDDPNAIFG
jgi:hypothetical protein